MEKYMEKYDDLKKTIIYNFKLGNGGIGDLIKYFISLLKICIHYDIQLKYMKNNIPIEKFITLKHKKMYIENNNIQYKNKYLSDINDMEIDDVYVMSPGVFYNNNKNSIFHNNIIIKGVEVFDFSDEVILNSNVLFPNNIDDYISIHLRLGDHFLETDMKYVECKSDVRFYDETKLFNYIENNSNTKNILFFCDNDKYKRKIKEKYNNIIIIYSDIGHTSFNNTTEKQVLDTITEFYIISNSKEVIQASWSGFSQTAASHKNIPLYRLY